MIMSLPSGWPPRDMCGLPRVGVRPDFDRLSLSLETTNVLLSCKTVGQEASRDQLADLQPDTRRRMDLQISLVVTSITHGAAVATQWRITDNWAECLWGLVTSLMWGFLGPFIAVSLHSSLLEVQSIACHWRLLWTLPLSVMFC